MNIVLVNALLTYTALLLQTGLEAGLAVYCLARGTLAIDYFVVAR